MCRTPPELKNNIITSLDFYTDPKCYSGMRERAIVSLYLCNIKKLPCSENYVHTKKKQVDSPII